MTSSERAHLDAVARLGCIVCRSQGDDTPAEIHHIRQGKGLSQRAGPFHVLPLCPAHHRTGGHGIAFHAGRRSWETRYGGEIEWLSQVAEQLACYLGQPLGAAAKTTAP